MTIENWAKITWKSLGELWASFLKFTPELIGALIVIIVGWFVAVAIGKIIAEVLKRIRFNMLFERGAWKEALEKAKWKVDPSGFIGALVKWVIFIVFLKAAVEILGLEEFATFMSSIVLWLPNLIVAAAIFVVAVIVAEYVPKIIRAAAEGMQLKYSKFIEKVTRWAIWVFAIMAILIQLGIAREMIMTLFSGFVAFLVIAGGLAFGLGGKDVAAEILQDLKRKIKED
ncbi:hypothetical protein J7K24_02560 [bacterium]|nr:hypothetical protein [bacterium]